MSNLLHVEQDCLSHELSPSNITICYWRDMILELVVTSKFKVCAMATVVGYTWLVFFQNLMQAGKSTLHINMDCIAPSYTIHGITLIPAFRFVMKSKIVTPNLVSVVNLWWMVKCNKSSLKVQSVMINFLALNYLPVSWNNYCDWCKSDYSVRVC